ncbi:MAG: hypothetical protein ACI4ES_01985, partial [Roseburia sp.]
CGSCKIPQWNGEAVKYILECGSFTNTTHILWDGAYRRKQVAVAPEIGIRSEARMKTGDIEKNA